MNNAFQPMDEFFRLKTITDLQNILYKMDYYQRESGFIADDILGNLTFFDSEPSSGGAFITRGDILDFIDIFNC